MQRDQLILFVTFPVMIRNGLGTVNHQPGLGQDTFTLCLRVFLIKIYTILSYIIIVPLTALLFGLTLISCFSPLLKFEMLCFSNSQARLSGAQVARSGWLRMWQITEACVCKTGPKQHSSQQASGASPEKTAQYKQGKNCKIFY